MLDIIINMIRPVQISPLSTTNKYYHECSNCGDKNTVTFTNRIINVDNKGELDELKEERCPSCDSILGED